MKVKEEKTETKPHNKAAKAELKTFLDPNEAHSTRVEALTSLLLRAKLQIPYILASENLRKKPRSTDREKGVSFYLSTVKTQAPEHLGTILTHEHDKNTIDNLLADLTCNYNIGNLKGKLLAEARASLISSPPFVLSLLVPLFDYLETVLVEVDDELSKDKKPKSSK